MECGCIEVGLRMALSAVLCTAKIAKSGRRLGAVGYGWGNQAGTSRSSAIILISVAGASI